MPIGGSIRFAELPPEWTPAADSRSIPTVAPNSARRVTLISQATVMPTQTGGFLVLPVELTTDEGTVHREEIRVSLVTALPVASPLTIDGDLSDWPVGTANVASEFGLITGKAPGSSGEVEARPRNATIGFVMRDEEYLYLAVNCETEASAGVPVSRRKGVRYDDQIPISEELVEILIDPLNAGTRSPSDLYHIVVKRAGSDLTEKGIHFEPPCGTHEPWAVEIDVATSTLKGRWTAELAIPLAAFGPLATDHTTWGSTTR